MAEPRRLAVFDIDGTLFRWQLYHEIVFELKNQGMFDEDTAHRLDTALIEWQAKQRTWHDYEAEIIRAWEPNIASLNPEELEKIAHTVVEREGHKIYNYTKQLLDSLKAEGYFVLAVSGSPQEIAELFAKMYGFDQCIGALYTRNGEHYTGEIARFVPGRKHEIIREFLDQNPDITLEGSVAVGDSEGDITMLEMVSRPIAFNPATGLLEAAMKHKWEVVLERKSVAYSLKEDDHGHYVLAETKFF